MLQIYVAFFVARHLYTFIDAAGIHNWIMCILEFTIFIIIFKATVSSVEKALIISTS